MSGDFLVVLWCRVTYEIDCYVRWLPNTMQFKLTYHQMWILMYFLIAYVCSFLQISTKHDNFYQKIVLCQAQSVVTSETYTIESGSKPYRRRPDVYPGVKRVTLMEDDGETSSMDAARHGIRYPKNINSAMERQAHARYAQYHIHISVGHRTLRNLSFMQSQTANKWVLTFFFLWLWNKCVPFYFSLTVGDHGGGGGVKLHHVWWP